MKDAKRPMPPSGASASDLAVLEAWVAGGLAKGTCAAPDAGGGGVYDTPTVCTSGTFANRDESSAFMLPGRACIGCHGRGDGPSFTAAGTVYSTAHEPDDCGATRWRPGA